MVRLLRKLYRFFFGYTVEELNALYKMKEAFASSHVSSLMTFYKQCKKARVVPKDMNFSEFYNTIENEGEYHKSWSPDEL
jgi:hypothetical protein